jgi:uncharacterized protein (TIGR02444 family)
MSESAFWKFSLRFYAVPGVAPACIEMQDRAGVDVNLLFLLLFLSDNERSITSDDVQRMDAAIATWRNDVVRPLRDVRRALKNTTGVSGAESLRSDVKRIELESERLQQEALFAKFPAASVGVAASREDAARANLAAYAQYLGGVPQAPLDAVLQAFLAV